MPLRPEPFNSYWWVLRYPDGPLVGTTLTHPFPATKPWEVFYWNSYEGAKSYCDSRPEPVKFTIHEVFFDISLAEEG